MTVAALRFLAPLLFLVSGMAALVYQVAWQRMLVVFAGGDVQAVTIIVTAFMAGLGLGSLAGGALADRLSPRGNLLVFAGVEVLVAAAGLGSRWFFHDFLYLQMHGVAASRPLTALVLVLCLLLPTGLMGLSLPVLSRALIRHLPEAAVQTGRLYGINTLGAALGSLLATWVLVPRGGLEGAIRTAAMLNLACAALLLPLLLRRTIHTRDATVCDDAFAVCGRERLPFAVLLSVFFVSGLVALALEMVWFRVLGAMLKSTAFTFGTLLAVYLGGLGLGALAGTFLAPRIWQPLRMFLLLQATAGLMAGLGFPLVFTWLRSSPSLAHVQAYLDSYEPMDANTAVLLLQSWWKGTLTQADAAQVWIFPLLHVALPVLLIGPATFLMGLGFPLLQKAAQTDATHIGRRIGALQAANIGGCMLGAASVSLILLPWFGSSGTLRLLVALSGGFALLATTLMRRWRWPWPAAVLAVFASCVAFMPGQASLWARVHGTTEERIRFAEDGSGLALLKTPASPGLGAATMVYVNGIGQSWIPFGGVHSLLGALPVLLHPAPESIAIIGLGSADTLYAMQSRSETRRIVSMEIIGAQLDVLREFAGETRDHALHNALEDPRVQHVVGDGRLHLMTHDERHDIIEADALRPTSAHAGTLYSEEYFRLLSRRLKPGGYAVTWCPTPRVLHTFAKVFPHVLVFGQIVVIGSHEPVEIDDAALQARLHDPLLQQHYRTAGIDVRALLAPCLGPQAQIVRIGPETDRSQFHDINTDLFPKDEFSLPAMWPVR